MLNSSPILSICIPTYNRFEYLQETLKSIISQEEFQNSNDVEIVISDNSSTDNTQELCIRLVSEYPNKIVYNRNNVNIQDNNFEKVLSLATGQYLKLNNDTFLHKEGSLKMMLNFILSADLTNTLLIFNFGNRGENKIFETVDEFIGFMDYYVTWIAIFGLSKKQFKSINEKFETKSRLGQVSVLLELASLNKIQIISMNKYHEVLDPLNKGGYDVIEVFLDNYFKIIKKYVNSRFISERTYKCLKESVIFNYVLPNLIAQQKKKNDFYFSYNYRSLKIFFFLFPNFNLILKYVIIEFKIFYFGMKTSIFNYFIKQHKMSF
jgi:abequosyltransferase